jgi:hypothetical protein
MIDARLTVSDGSVEQIKQCGACRFEAYVNGQLVGITNTPEAAGVAIREYRIRVLAQGPVDTGFDPLPALTRYVVG